VSTLPLLRAFLYGDEWDATADSNQIAVKASQPPLDGTTFRLAITNGGWEEVGASGRKTLDLSFDGFWSAATTTAQDVQSFNQLAGAERVWTVGDDETETAPCFLFKGKQVSYQAFGTQNTSAPFSVAVKSSDGLGGMARGQLAAKLQSKAATGQLGSICNLGAASSTQYVYVSLHVFPTAGTTITVQVQSAAAVGFASPTTRATLGPITAVGGTWMTRLAGPFTDAYWRLNVSAITGTFSVAGAIAVQ
jgi:hypothetical protein